ncbi:MAG: hypothetical protein M4579_002469 [Chaenotheca gracillima]|nr:MAG: hypothetical protein M4579_002469 [Chaenotheca gracillima]
MDNVEVDRLREDFCPPIDSALFFAIVSDYDLANPESSAQLRVTLEALKESASVEEETGFDPSGSSGAAQESSDGSPGFEVETSPSDRADSYHAGEERSTSRGTDSTSVSRSLSRLGLEDGASSSDVEGVDKSTPIFGQDLDLLDVAGKRELLREMFPKLMEFTIDHTLAKCHEDYGRAVEELLNLVFLEEFEERGEERVLLKGVDGFAQGLGSDSRGRKKNSRKQKQKLRHELEDARRASSLPASGESGQSSVKASKWDTAQQDVDFLVSRTKLSRPLLYSLYHENGGVMQGTIRAILRLERENNSEVLSDDEAIQANAFALGQDFTTIPAADLTTLIRLTHPSIASAHEVAKALTTPSLQKATGGIEIVTRLPPLDLSSSPATRSASSSAKTKRSSLADATALANSYNVARHSAFTQASAAYRKGKSQPLMGAAASYYSGLGRDYDAKAKQYGAAAADALVDAQSSGSELDLHGVSVKDAVRIASDKVSTWWAELGDARYGARASSGPRYRIVTGVGRHSEGGKGRLGPAVGRMLLKQGWKVEIGEGVLIITGLARNG